jgi:hypothetical protein
VVYWRGWLHPLAKVLTHLGPAEKGRPRVLTACIDAGTEASGSLHIPDDVPVRAGPQL